MAEPEKQIENGSEAEEEEDLCAPNWLVESLKFLNRNDLINSALSYTCRLFQRLCWPKLHGNVEPHTVPFLFIGLDNRTSPPMAKAIVKGSNYNNKDGLPIPSIAPPDYIIGFKRIFIVFLDDKVIKFLELIVPQMEKISLSFFFGCVPKMDRIEYAAVRSRIGRALALIAPKLHQLCSRDRFQYVDNIVAIYPSISVNQCALLEADFNKFTADWLEIRHPDEAQKIAILYYYSSFKKIKIEIMKIMTKFLEATHAANFFAELALLPVWEDDDFIPFTIENKRTGEILAAYKQPREIYEGDVLSYQSVEYQQFLVRHPKDEGHYWREKGKRQIKHMKNSTMPNLTRIHLHETEFWAQPSDEQMPSNENSNKQSSVPICHKKESDENIPEQRDFAENIELLEPCCCSSSLKANISSSEPAEGKEEK